MSTTDGQNKQARTPAALSAAGHGDAETRKLFSRFDADGDGRISPSELAAVAGAISPPPSESAGGREVGAMMDQLDADRDGYVDLGEFAAFHAPGGRDLDAELRDAFDVYDINGDGRISVAELSKVLGRIGEGCSTQECERMIASVGVDGEGYVGFQEFKKMMSPDAAGAQAQPQPAAGVTDDKPKTE
ncbi:probable calcium-binding protein CML16 [Lolium rigidum]|uniref:probable calcium-binding protein CML16 n=1 Tax=Lolium rigidum TaxID=89674 RepID=UPI001F5CF31A|nr:probable calcium-binding protein CML16 [Lolium rigidum]